jgi:hypothetical protein
MSRLDTGRWFNPSSATHECQWFRGDDGIHTAKITRSA